MNSQANNLIRIERPALRYHGGKFLLAPWIISHFPPHTSYVEPYAGAASVLLLKSPSKLETINDSNDLVVNFFDVLRTRKNDLLNAIRLTPYSRREFARAQEPCDDPLERARRFYVWSWQGRGRAGVVEPGGWRFMSRDTRGTTPSDDFSRCEHLELIADRLRRVQIECGEAIQVIRRFDTPDTLFYVDPPYVGATRSARWSGSAYRCEMDDDSHRELAQALRGVQGMVALSGYPSPLYEELYGDWVRVSRTARIDSGAQRIEALWLSPSSQARLNPTLF